MLEFRMTLFSMKIMRLNLLEFSESGPNKMWHFRTCKDYGLVYHIAIKLSKTANPKPDLSRKMGCSPVLTTIHPEVIFSSHPNCRGFSKVDQMKWYHLGPRIGSQEQAASFCFDHCTAIKKGQLPKRHS